MLWTPGLQAAPRLRVTGFELSPVRATARTVWLFVRLRTDAGLTGLGEASDAFGFANTTTDDAARMTSELGGFFEFVKGQSPLEIAAYRQRAEPLVARGGLVSATACSAIEQACGIRPGSVLEVPMLTVRRTNQRHTADSRQHQSRDDGEDAGGVCGDGESRVKDGFRPSKARRSTGFRRRDRRPRRSTRRSKTASRA